MNWDWLSLHYICVFFTDVDNRQRQYMEMVVKESYCATYCQLSWLLLTPFIGNGLTKKEEGKKIQKYTHLQIISKQSEGIKLNGRSY